MLPRPGRFGRLLAGSISFSLIAMWSLFAGIAYETHLDEWDSASAFCGDVASLLEQDIARNIETYDLSIKAASHDMDDPNVRRLPPELLRKVVFDQSANASGLGSILVLDRDGKVVMDSKGHATPGLDLSDRDYFVAQRDGTDQSRPFVSRPFTSRISHLVSIGVSRRRSAADGSFDGVVVGTMTLDYLARLFRVVHLPPGSTITLIHRDGTILLREPEVTGEIGARLKASDLAKHADQSPSGIFVKRSSLDDVERMFAYKEVGSLPIYMAVGLSTSEVFRHWRTRLELIGGGFLMLTAIILFLGFMLARELDRRTKAESTLADLAATDGLTLLANRRRFDEVLEIEWRRAVRESTNLSLLMIDGDFFKAFNDTYGHIEGDEALRRLSAAFRSCVSRPGDLIARFGGEEFVVLLPRTDADGAEQIAQAIRHAVIAVDVPHQASPTGILTVSIGVASSCPKTGEAAAHLVESADSALYAAKAAGRDRIEVSDRDHRFGTHPVPIVA